MPPEVINKLTLKRASNKRTKVPEASKSKCQIQSNTIGEHVFSSVADPEFPRGGANL